MSKGDGKTVPLDVNRVADNTYVIRQLVVLDTKFKKDKAPDMQALYNRGASLSQISAWLDTSVSYIRKLIKK